MVIFMAYYIPKPFTSAMAKKEVDTLYTTKRAKYKDLFKQGYSQRLIAGMFGVSAMTVWISLRSHHKAQEPIRKYICRDGETIDFVR